MANIFGDLWDAVSGTADLKKASKAIKKAENKNLSAVGYRTGTPALTKSQYKAAKKAGTQQKGVSYDQYKKNYLAQAAQTASAPGSAVGPSGGTTVTPASGVTPGYLPVAQALYDEQKAATAAAEAKARGDLTAAGANQQNVLTEGGVNQQNVLRQALEGQLGAIDAGEARQAGALQPYADYGAGAIPLMEGGFGEDPASAAGFMERYENSPLYQAQLQASMELANRGLERAGAASGGLNSGGLIRESLREGNLLGRKNIGDYYGLLNNRMGIGMNAANALSGIYGQGTGLRTSAYGDYGGRSASAYGDIAGARSGAYGTTGANLADNTNNALARALQSGQLFSGNVGNAFNQIYGSNTATGAGKAAYNTGAGATKAGFWSGAADLAGDIFGGKMPTFS